MPEHAPMDESWEDEVLDTEELLAQLRRLAEVRQ